jgi:hypothetical protein
MLVDHPLEEVSPLTTALRGVPWQQFATLTLSNNSELCDRVAGSMFRAGVARLSRLCRVPFDRIGFLCRGEFGKGGRFHYHCLFVGLGPFGAATDVAMALRKFWRELHKTPDSMGLHEEMGHYRIVQVWPYDSTLDGVGYVMKGVERYPFLSEAQNYEVTKFGLTDHITMSESLLRKVTRGLARRHRCAAVDTKQKSESVEPGVHGVTVGTFSENQVQRQAGGECNALEPAELSRAEIAWLCRPAFSVPLQR